LITTTLTREGKLGHSKNYNSYASIEIKIQQSPRMPKKNGDWVKFGKVAHSQEISILGAEITENPGD